MASPPPPDYADEDREQELPHTANPLKTQLISQLFEERREAEESGGAVRNRNPLDESEPFQRLCMACRRGDVKAVQSLISFERVNVNAVDRFDYPPLTLASLCGHYDVVQLLLENGAVCERDTFQGERCLYNALNNTIRNLLLKYDYSKSSDPHQPWASAISSLLSRHPLDSTDVSVLAADADSSLLSEFRLHKLLLSARSPYFRRKFQVASAPPNTLTETELRNHSNQRIVRNVRLSNTVDARAFKSAVNFMYLADIPDESDTNVLRNIERLSRHLEIPELWDMIAETGTSDAKKRRQRRTAATETAQSQLDAWFREFVLGRKVLASSPAEAAAVRIDQSNDSYADVLLQATDPETGEAALYPAHKGMLRSDYFSTMFTSRFREGQRPGAHDPLPIVELDASPPVIELVLSFLYSEKTTIPIEYAIDLLYVADQLLLDRLRLKCAHVISTEGENENLPFSIYDVVRAGWACRVRRLEEFGAKYIADRLERYLRDPELAELVAESAERIRERQETDTIEVVDDVRYYLGVRFRQRIGKADPFLEEEEEEEDEEEEDEEVTVVKGARRREEIESPLEREERLQHELLEGIDELLEGLRLEA